MGTDHGFICRTCGVRWLAEEVHPFASPTWRTPAIPSILIRHAAVMVEVGRVISNERGAWHDSGPLAQAVVFLAEHAGHEVDACDEYGRPEPPPEAPRPPEPSEEP